MITNIVSLDNGKSEAMVCDITQTWVFLLGLPLTTSYPYTNFLVKQITLPQFDLITNSYYLCKN